MENVLLVVLLLLALSLIGVVLLQRSEGGGLGMGGGGGAGGMMSSRGAASALSKLTWLLGISFLAVSLAMTIISAQKTGNSSAFDRTGASESAAPAQDETAVPALPDVEELMPDTSTPVAPPRAE
ncbi:MAG: preprotein translocase subunit SecG [Maritimibacter sp.]